MMRTAGKLFGGAAGVTASGSASQAQCRAQQPRFSVQHSKEELLKCGASTAAAPVEEEADDDWLLADLKPGEAIFSPHEIQDAVDYVVSSALPGYSAKEGRSGVRTARIIDLDDCKSDTSSEELDSSDADLHIQAAERQVIAPFAARNDFNRALAKLLHNPGVHRACIKALEDDADFRAMLTAEQTTVEIPANNYSLLPFAAQQATAAEENQTSANLAQSLADGLVRLGENIKQKASGARDMLGKLLIKLGYGVHALLGRPFSSTPVEENDPEAQNKNAEAVGNALVMIVCAILALVLVKRVHKVRFV